MNALFSSAYALEQLLAFRNEALEKSRIEKRLALARFGRIEAGVLDHGSLREINAYSLESYDCTTKLHAISPIGVVFYHTARILSASTSQLQEKRGLKISRLVKDK